ncbi:ABC transporter substrate-binding protein, partial [Undibacterium luofuense]|uniref:ABC transporter substrate-binding protein n=1 Tax=Undibacterium luofuense TaxID=2828733 RepID=UPI0030EE12FB
MNRLLLFRWVGLLFGLSGVVLVQALFSLSVRAQPLPEMPFAPAANQTHPAKQKIEFWTMSLKPKFIPYFRELVQRYEASHPHVQVEWVDFPWDILQLKLITAIAAGTPPALVNLSVPWAEEMARDGLLQPIDHLMPPINPYTSGALNDVRFNGKI